jgi:ABC-type glycerol-3-phosphate transport system substrate-binding protein
MIRLTRARRLGAALAASAIVLTACGGGGDDDSAGDTNTSEESESSAPEGDGTLTLGSLLPQTGTSPSSARPSSRASTWRSRT